MSVCSFTIPLNNGSGNRNFELYDELHARRPPTVNMKELEMDPALNFRCLAEQLRSSHIGVENDHHALLNYSVGLSNELQKRFDANIELLSVRHTNEWLHKVITGDEIWVLYINYTRKSQLFSRLPKNQSKVNFDSFFIKPDKITPETKNCVCSKTPRYPQKRASK